MLWDALDASDVLASIMIAVALINLVVTVGISFRWTGRK